MLFRSQAMGDDFTAKNFRTWAASALAFEKLAQGHISLKAMLEAVAGELGNTPAISRKSYVHPALIDLAKGDQDGWRENLRLPRKTRFLSRFERGLIALLDDLDTKWLPIAA